MGKLRQLEVSSGNVKRAEAVRRELRQLEDIPGNREKAKAVRRELRQLDNIHIGSTNTNFPPC